MAPPRVEGQLDRDVVEGDVQLAGQARLDGGQTGWRRRVKRVISLTPLDLGDCRLDARASPPDDPVRIAVRLGGMRPLVKVRIARKHNLARRDADDLVRARCGERVAVDVLKRRAGGDGGSVGLRKLREEVGIGRGQVEGDGARGVVSDDALRQVTARRSGSARGRADEVLEVEVVAGHEVALSRSAKVLGPDRLAAGVADPGSQPECVCATTVGRRRQGDSEVRYDLIPVAATDPLERCQAIIGHDLCQERSDRPWAIRIE